MSYKSFNLTTLQLPAPTSNMTKAEYKDAYGIDLDNIDIYKFTLILFGKEKYAIDKIKVVEGGYEIFFNGRILSITDIVQTSGEVYDVENAKPIYVHPVTLVGSSNMMRFTCLIFNNSPTPFTIDSFINYISQLYASGGETIRIMISGTYVVTDGVLIGSYISQSSATQIYITGNNTDGTGRTDQYTISGFKNLISTLYDGVNKIN